MMGPDFARGPLWDPCGDHMPQARSRGSRLIILTSGLCERLKTSDWGGSMELNHHGTLGSPWPQQEALCSPYSLACGQPSGFQFPSKAGEGGQAESVTGPTARA